MDSDGLGDEPVGGQTISTRFARLCQEQPGTPVHVLRLGQVVAEPEPEVPGSAPRCLSSNL